ncbi:MAG: nitroreductase [Clostridium sp.]|nr:nitroreductase [Clostridium sp.]
MRIDFDITRAVAARHSVRTFDRKNPPSDETCQALTAFAHSAGNPFGIKDARIGLVRKAGLSGQKLGTYGVTRGAATFLGLGVPDREEAYIAGAYQMEATVLYATSLGIGTVWLGGTFTRNAFSAAFGFKRRLALPAIVALGYPAGTRLLERMMKSLAKSNTRKPWEELFFDNRIGYSLTKDAAGPYAQALENMRLAPSSLNGQPWRALRIGRHFHFYADFNDGITGQDRKMKYLDMGIALCHFHLTLLQQGVGGRFVNRNPGITVPDGYHYAMSWDWNDPTTPED